MCNKVCEILTKAYNESALSKTRVYEWRFQDVREDVEDDERPGRPSTSTTDENVEKVKEMAMNDRRITIREVADDVDISIGLCHEIFSNVLGMKRVAAKFVLKLLNFEQKQRRVEVAQESLTMPQPPYSPEMAPCDFFLFPKIKRNSKGRRFTAIYDIKSASLKELAIPKIEFEKCFEDWKKRWHKCFFFFFSRELFISTHVFVTLSIWNETTNAQVYDHQLEKSYLDGGGGREVFSFSNFLWDIL